MLVVACGGLRVLLSSYCVRSMKITDLNVVVFRITVTEVICQRLFGKMS